MRSLRARTFDDCTDAYIKANRAGWKNEKHVAQWESTLGTYASPVIGGLAVRNIDTAHIVSVLQPIWEAKPETASRVRGRIEAVLNWAKSHRCRGDENPARWKRQLDKGFADSKIIRIAYLTIKTKLLIRHALKLCNITLRTFTRAC